MNRKRFALLAAALVAGIGLVTLGGCCCGGGWGWHGGGHGHCR